MTSGCSSQTQDGVFDGSGWPGREPLVFGVTDDFSWLERTLLPPEQALYVSATPGDWGTAGRVAEQLIRATGLMDPEVIVRPARHQVDDLVAEIRARVAVTERVLVTTNRTHHPPLASYTRGRERFLRLPTS